MVLLAVNAAAQPRGTRCFAACERLVHDARERAVACAICVTHPADPTAWLGSATVSTAALLEDDDWQIRWAGLEREAQQRHLTPTRALTQWVLKGEPQRPCVTAAHRAGAARRPLRALLEPRALERCLARDTGLEAALQIELYDPWPPVRRQALEHLSQALEVPLGRAVLAAAAHHPAAFDPLLIDTLCEVTEGTDATCPAVLVAGAGPGDETLMNRLLAVLGAKKDEAVKRFDAPEPDAHRHALPLLAELAPLTEAELLAALDDADASIRGGAARALARGEGRTLTEAVVARLEGHKPASASQQEALVRVLGGLHPDDCAAGLLAAWKGAGLAPPLARLVLITAAACDWSVAGATAEVQAARGDPAGVAALASAPRTAALMGSLQALLGNPDPGQRAAAIEALAAHRAMHALHEIRVHLTDADAGVRAAAVRAVAALPAPSLETDLLARLGDADAGVRRAAAEALPQVASPRAMAALDRAAKHDADDGVKMVAARALRKLGRGSLAP